jgi:hypothetical protein
VKGRPLDRFWCCGLVIALIIDLEAARDSHFRGIDDCRSVEVCSATAGAQRGDYRG